MHVTGKVKMDWIFLYFQRILSIFSVFSSFFSAVFKEAKVNYALGHVNPLSTNPTKWSNSFKQFVGNSVKGLS